jgi:hypothetical protein
MVGAELLAKAGEDGESIHSANREVREVMADDLDEDFAIPKNEEEDSPEEAAHPIPYKIVVTDRHVERGEVRGADKEVLLQPAVVRKKKIPPKLVYCAESDTRNKFHRHERFFIREGDLYFLPAEDLRSTFKHVGCDRKWCRDLTERIWALHEKYGGTDHTPPSISKKGKKQAVAKQARKNVPSDVKRMPRDKPKRKVGTWDEVEVEKEILNLKKTVDQLRKAKAKPGGGPRRAARGGPCYNCGRQGHIARDCRAPRREESRRRPERRDVRCFECGENGHIARNCRNRRGTQGERHGEESRRRDTGCRKCGMRNHTTAEHRDGPGYHGRRYDSRYRRRETFANGRNTRPQGEFGGRRNGGASNW